jgi:hypothetical protein
LWFVDGVNGTMRQFCGRGCLPEDPDFMPEDHGSVEDAYTLDGLYRRFGHAP